MIAQSGSPTLSRSTEQAIECTNEMMDILGCKTVADLMKIDSRKIVESSGILLMRTAPERDGKYLPLDPYKAYLNGAAKDIDFLQGCDKEEFEFFETSLGDNFKTWLDDRKANRLSVLNDKERELVESFFNEWNPEGNERYSRLFDQLWFNSPAIRMSENQTRAGGKSYTYYFNHPEMLSESEKKFDETFSKAMRNMWVQFAKTGNPSLSAELSPYGKAIDWPLYNVKDKTIMILDDSGIHAEKESEIKITDWERTYFLTDYYCF